MNLRAQAGVAALGVIQGLTEFLPVSSSGHLVIGSHVLHLAAPSLLLDVIVHVGTLLPVLWLYRPEIGSMLGALGGLGHPREAWNDSPPFRLAMCIAIGTLPTGLIGALLHDTFEQLFSSVTAVAVAFLVTGAILVVAQRLAARRPQSDDPHSGLTAGRSLGVGLAQGLAITPGISRSGTTIAAALALGVEREMAARLSFLLSVPAIVGATILQLRKVSAASVEVAPLAIAAIAAAITGYLALRWVVALVRRGALHWFAAYLWPLGIALLVYTLAR